MPLLLLLAFIGGNQHQHRLMLVIVAVFSLSLSLAAAAAAAAAAVCDAAAAADEAGSERESEREREGGRERGEASLFFSWPCAADEARGETRGGSRAVFAAEAEPFSRENRAVFVRKRENCEVFFRNFRDIMTSSYYQ